MIFSRLLLTIIGLLVLFNSFNIFAAEKSAKERQNQQSSTTSAMTELQTAFKKASPPQKSDLTGNWVLIKNVSTEKFLSGREGQDHVLYNNDGIRRSNMPGNPLEWTLTFSVEDGRLQVTSDTVWEPTGDTSFVKFASDGDMLFEKDYGGDSAYVYRCRASNSQELVCLLEKNKNGHGIEFKKTTK